MLLGFYFVLFTLDLSIGDCNDISRSESPWDSGYSSMKWYVGCGDSSVVRGQIESIPQIYCKPAWVELEILALHPHQSSIKPKNKSTPQQTIYKQEHKNPPCATLCSPVNHRRSSARGALTPTSSFSLSSGASTKALCVFGTRYLTMPNNPKKERKRKRERR